MKLYTYPGNKNAFKALIAAEYVGARIEVPEFQMDVDNKTPEFLKMNPHGKVPVLQTDKGSIFESNAIARYVSRLADVGLYGTNLQQLAVIEQWIDFVSNEIDAPLLSWVLPLLGYGPYDKKKETAAIAAVKSALTTLNKYLEGTTYLVGDNVTLADIIACCNLYYGYTKVFDQAFREAFPCVTRYFLTLVHQPHFKKVMGDVTLCEAPLKYSPPKKEPKQPKEDKKPKDDAAAAAAAPAEKKESKPKTFVDLLPPTSMPMDSWKRLYSNTPPKNFREICITRLWEGGPVPKSPNDEVFPGYDPEGYSFWFCEYKFSEENTVNFMVMNKVGGFLQRVDYARKYAFGVMCILKKDKIFPIHGVWMFRGQDLPPPMLEECYDMELYEWRKADLSNPADKKRLEDMICEEDEIDGLENVECKVFK